MKTKYLGGKQVDIKDTPYKDYTPSNWALEYIMRYGGIDGSHHKTWVLDQVARILNGVNVIVELHSWDNGFTEYRIHTDDTTQQYNDWVKETYGYDTGTAP